MAMPSDSSSKYGFKLLSLLAHLRRPATICSRSQRCQGRLFLANLCVAAESLGRFRAPHDLMKFTERSLDLATKRGTVSGAVSSDVLKLVYEGVENSTRPMVA